IAQLAADWCCVDFPGRLLLRRRCFGEARQHPHFPIPALENVDCGPAVDDLNGGTARVLARDDDLAQPETRVGAERPHLINRYLAVVQSRFESAFVGLRDVRVWSSWIDEDAVLCEQRSYSCSVLRVEL